MCPNTLQLFFCVCVYPRAHLGAGTSACGCAHGKAILGYGCELGLCSQPCACMGCWSLRGVRNRVCVLVLWGTGVPVFGCERTLSPAGTPQRRCARQSLTPKAFLGEDVRGSVGWLGCHWVGAGHGGCLLTPISPSGLARSPGSAERPGAVPLPAAPRRPPAPSPRALLQRGRAAGRRSPRAFHQPQPALGPLRAGAAGAAAGTPAGRSPTPETSPAPPRARLPRAAAPRRAPQRAQRALHLPMALPVGTRRG